MSSQGISQKNSKDGKFVFHIVLVCRKSTRLSIEMRCFNLSYNIYIGHNMKKRRSVKHMNIYTHIAHYFNVAN